MLGPASFLSLASLSEYSAFAQPNPNDLYESLLDQATKAAEKDRFEEALQAFIPAYKIKQEYRVACTIARFSLRVRKRRLLDAARFYETCRRTAPPPETEEGIERRAAELAELEVAKAHVMSVSIIADEGASIHANGDFVGLAPLGFALFFEPGVNVVDARKGKNIISEKLKGERGDVFTVDLKSPRVVDQPIITPTHSALLRVPPAPLKSHSVMPDAHAQSDWNQTHVVVGTAAFILSVPALGVGTWAQITAIDADEHKTYFITQAAQARLHENMARYDWTIDAANRADQRRVARQNLATGLFVVAGVLVTTGIVSFTLGDVRISPRLMGMEGSFVW